MPVATTTASRGYLRRLAVVVVVATAPIYPTGPYASTCGMGVVHTLLTQRVSDNPTRAASELVSSRDRGIGVDEPYLLI